MVLFWMDECVVSVLFAWRVYGYVRDSARSGKGMNNDGISCAWFIS